MAETKPRNITDDQFEREVLNHQGISVVDFWAPWCGPCIQMAPGLEAFAAANATKVEVFKLDVDENPKYAEKYEIRSVPTIIFFRNGQPQHVARGTLSLSGLQKKLDEILTEAFDRNRTR
jgi:thioredoxin 1